MNSRVTHGLLATIAVLLAANLLVALDLLPRANAASLSATQDVVRARRIELVAANGQVVAQLHTSDDGAGQLRLRDGRGEVRVKLGATPPGAGLVLLDRNTEPAVRLVAGDEGPMLALSRRGVPTHVVRP